MTHTALITMGWSVCLPHEVVICADARRQETFLPGTAQNQTEKITGLFFILERPKRTSSSLSKGQDSTSQTSHSLDRYCLPCVLPRVRTVKWDWLPPLGPLSGTGSLSSPCWCFRIPSATLKVMESWRDA